MTAELESLRADLDRIDDRLIDALAERQRLIDKVAQHKSSQAASLHDGRREKQILARLAKKGRTGDLDGFFVMRVFREILDYSIRRQQGHLTGQSPQGGPAKSALTVGHLGIEGSNSQLAAAKFFTATRVHIVYRGCASFAELLEGVQDGSLDRAVLPLENTTAGSINASYDLLARTDLSLIGEEILEVNHCLLMADEGPLGAVRRVYSHPEALTQCSEFLRTLTQCHLESVTDTATAAKIVAEQQDPSCAAIANADAARIYGLHVARRNLANQRENFTRFGIVARDAHTFDSRIPCKTSLMFATAHEKGALLACLNILNAHGLNLTKLESRPRPNAPWEYLFYVDFEGNIADDQVQAALRELTSKSGYLKVLGSYPQRTTGTETHADLIDAIALQTDGTSQACAVDAAQCNAKSGPAEPKALSKSPYTLVARQNIGHDSVIRIGQVVVGTDRPVVIAGPCSVESRDQVLSSARVVRECGADMLRGGCFKPRTSPYSFQGLGYEGLELLAEAGRQFDLPTVTEVLHPGDVRPVAQIADVIQIGARNMQNFPLLKEVGKVDRPVLLKRGMMATVDEWLAAAEYILANGNQRVILCERGIRTFETSTRFTLDLNTIPVVRERTHLPILVDPSHACGTSRWVSPLALASLAAGAHGLMVEIHPDPEKALCDGPQSLTFDVFADLMSRVRMTHRSPGDVGTGDKGTRASQPGT